MRRSRATSPQGAFIHFLTRGVTLTCFQEHRLELEEGIKQLKPGAQLRRQGVGRFRENPTLRSSPEVFLYIALTKLDKSNGMFSFLVPPEDKSTPENEWKEEEVDMKPGEGLMWRGDCVRKSGGGYGGIMLITQYE